MMKHDEFGNRLRELRANKARIAGRRIIPQHEIASGFGISTAAYSSWESGRTRPDISLLPRIADYFEVSIDYLLGHSPDYLNMTRQNVTETSLVWTLRRQPESDHERIGVELWQRLSQGESLTTIMTTLNLSSRRSITRYLQDVIISELIRIDYLPQRQDLSEQVKRAFGLKEVIVVPTLRDSERPIGYGTFLLGEAARNYFRANVYEGMQVGLTGGYSISRLVYSLRRGDCRSIDVYPLAENPVTEAVSLGANSLVGTLAYRHYGYRVRGHMLAYSSPMDWAEAKDYRRFTPTLRILAKAKSVDIVFMGLGIFGRRRAPIDWLGYLLDTRGTGLEKLEDRDIVGDILYHLVDGKGNMVVPEISNLICSIGLTDLQALVQMNVPVVAIASRSEKAAITRAAIRGKFINVLIIDDALAKTLLRLT